MVTWIVINCTVFRLQQNVVKRANPTPTSPLYSSRPAACSTMSMVTSPAEGMEAAPTAATVEVSATTTV